MSYDTTTFPSTVEEALALPSVMVPCERCYCGAEMKPVVQAPFYVKGADGSPLNLPSVFHWCRQCDLMVRNLNYDNPIVASHFDIASYTSFSHEENLRKARNAFYGWLLKHVQRHGGPAPKSVLDFGCSYGHLLDLCKDSGSFDTVGVEVASHVLTRLRAQGRHRAFSSLEEVPDASFDAVFAVDSIYYVEGDPQRLITQLASKLRPNGILLTRTTNRNLLYRAAACIKKKTAPHGGTLVSYRFMGDSKHGFSQRALERYAQNAGLRCQASYRFEHKPRGIGRSTYDFAAAAVCRCSLHMVDFATGLVMVFKAPD